MTATIWTIGHGDRSFDDIERHLAGLDITMIADIRPRRDVPGAPDFEHRRLEELAAKAGIGYRWMATATGEQAAEVDGEVTDDLIALSSASRTVLLCTELDADRCHRSTVLAPMLQERGIAVVHILPDGTTRPYELPLPFDR